jgi:hypothetical protein
MHYSNVHAVAAAAHACMQAACIDCSYYRLQDCLGAVAKLPAQSDSSFMMALHNHWLSGRQCIAAFLLLLLLLQVLGHPAAAAVCWINFSAHAHCGSLCGSQ